MCAAVIANACALWLHARTSHGFHDRRSRVVHWPGGLESVVYGASCGMLRSSIVKLSPVLELVRCESPVLCMEVIAQHACR